VVVVVRLCRCACALTVYQGLNLPQSLRVFTAPLGLPRYGEQTGNGIGRPFKIALDKQPINYEYGVAMLNSCNGVPSLVNMRDISCRTCDNWIKCWTSTALSVWHENRTIIGPGQGYDPAQVAVSRTYECVLFFSTGSKSLCPIVGILCSAEPWAGRWIKGTHIGSGGKRRQFPRILQESSSEVVHTTDPNTHGPRSGLHSLHHFPKSTSSSRPSSRPNLRFLQSL
jgi:hypothetical protein